MKKITTVLLVLCMVLGIASCNKAPEVIEIEEKFAQDDFLEAKRVLETYKEDSSLKDSFLKHIKTITTEKLYETNYDIESSFINYGDYVLVAGDGEYDKAENEIKDTKDLYIIDKNNNKCLLETFDSEIWSISIKDNTTIFCGLNSPEGSSKRIYIEYDLIKDTEKTIIEDTSESYFYYKDDLYQEKYQKGEKELLKGEETIYKGEFYLYLGKDSLIITPYEEKYIIEYDGKKAEKIDTKDNNPIYQGDNVIYQFITPEKIEIDNQKENKNIFVKYDDIKGYTFVKLVGNYYISQFYDAESQPENFLIDLANGNKYRIKEFVLNSTISSIFEFNNKIYFYNIKKNGWDDKECYPKLMELDLSQLQK